MFSTTSCHFTWTEDTFDLYQLLSVASTRLILGSDWLIAIYDTIRDAILTCARKPT